MKTYLKKFIQATFCLFLFLFASTSVFADIMKLQDGTILQGKIVREDDNAYFFTNASGTFEVRKVYVTKLFVTKSHIEDRRLSKQYNFKINSREIKKNYQAGERKKMLMQRKRRKKKYFEYWDYGRISVSASYFTTLSSETGKRKIDDILTSGFSGQLAYEQGLDMLLDMKPYKKKKKGQYKGQYRKKYRKSKPRPWWMPGLRIEWSYLYFTNKVFVKNDREISGSTWNVGPMWFYPSPHNVWGAITLACLPGVSFLNINNRVVEEEKQNYSFAMTLFFGYEYAIKEQVAIVFHFRYTYITDENVGFHGIGASFGLSIRLW